MSDRYIKEIEDAFVKKVLELYIPKAEVITDHCEILNLNFLKKYECERRRCYSLKNGRVYDDWQNFLSRLPSSKDEVVPRPLEKYWRWKMYRKYEPVERTDFRKTMRNGPGTDKHGLLPVTAEDSRFYRSFSTCKNLNSIKTNNTKK